MDLKAHSVLLTKTNSIAKIGDVDMAQVMGSTTLQQSRAATFAYSAPELILNSACTEKVIASVLDCKELCTVQSPAYQTLRCNCNKIHVCMLLTSSFDLQVDMYSFGVILWELITTEVPRRGRLRAIKVSLSASTPWYSVTTTNPLSRLQPFTIQTFTDGHARHRYY